MAGDEPVRRFDSFHVRQCSISRSPIAQLVERPAVNREVRGSSPRRGASVSVFRSRVAQLVEHRLDKTGVGGSCPPAGTSFFHPSRCGAAGSARVSGARGRRFETCHRDQSSISHAFGCGRSSTARTAGSDPADIGSIPIGHPQAQARHSVRRELERQSTGLLSRLVGVRAPGDAPTPTPAGSAATSRPGRPAHRRESCADSSSLTPIPSWRNWLDAPVSEAGAHGRVRSTRTEGTINT
jgi:hypothetical protein